MAGYGALLGMAGQMMGGMGGGKGGGGGMSATPWGKAAGVAMETTGRGMATANPRISAAISGAAAGEHSAYARMAQGQRTQDSSDMARAIFEKLNSNKKLFEPAPNIAPQVGPGLDQPNHGGF